MTEDVAVVRAILVTLPTTNLSAAVWSYVLMKLGVFQFAYIKPNDI